MQNVLSLLISITLAAQCAGTDNGRDTYESREGPSETGVASYYASSFQGRRTASGEVYDENKLTAAHRTLPFGVRVRVTNLENGKSVVVRINDRGPFKRGRVIDLSRKAARELGFIRQGLARVRVVTLPSRK